MHSANAYPINALNTDVIVYNDIHSQTALGILKNCGRRRFPVGEANISPDGQWTSRRGLKPTLLFEVAIHQSVPTVLTKVRAILHHSNNPICVVVLKFWQDPIPENIVAVATVWRKQSNLVQETDLLATDFVSFGNKPPTVFQLAEYLPTVGHGLSVPPLIGVTGGSNSISSTDDNLALSVFHIRVPARALFHNPDLEGPDWNVNLPDLELQLVRVKGSIIEGVIDDILINAYKLSIADLQRIVSCADIQASYPMLHRFAVEQLN